MRTYLRTWSAGVQRNGQRYLLSVEADTIVQANQQIAAITGTDPARVGQVTETITEAARDRLGRVRGVFERTRL